MAPPEPAKIQLEVSRLDSIFDRSRPNEFPHGERKVVPGVASYLESLAREKREHPTVELEISVATGPVEATAKVRAGDDLHAFFACERDRVDLDLAVNRTEGWGSLRFAAPLAVGFGAIAGFLSYVLPSLLVRPGFVLLSALPALFFAVIVWVLIWDPVEMLLFDAYLLRARRSALDKLSQARVLFVDRPSPA